MPKRFIVAAVGLFLSIAGRQNDSRSSIAHVNALGVTLSWHF